MLRARTQALWQLKGSFRLVDMEGSFYFAIFDLEEDYIKALTGGPWMTFGAYLTVQPWSLEFDARSSAISKVVTWVRIPGLSFRYYHKSTLRAIGTLLGNVVKIDYMTEMKGRGRYARLAILMDLQKPLVPWIMVDGKKHGVEYEGLPLICFECGLYGHPKERCKNKEQATIVENTPGKTSTSPVTTSATFNQTTGNAVVDESPESAPSQFGAWMQAPITPGTKILGVEVGHNTIANSGTMPNQELVLGHKMTKASSKAQQQISHKSLGAKAQTTQVYRKKEIPGIHSDEHQKRPTQIESQVLGTHTKAMYSESGSKTENSANEPASQNGDMIAEANTQEKISVGETSSTSKAKGRIHLEDGTQRLELPVSNTAFKLCGGERLQLLFLNYYSHGNSLELWDEQPPGFLQHEDC
ncbi:hypothetical protein K1719_020374 [Acacia pycnantha]|nr:hypothetical protein K1719_020374 [Acacia pycnantha]